MMVGQNCIGCSIAITMSQLVGKPTDDPDAIEANVAHDFITQGAFDMIKAMIMVGEILHRKKAQLAHGKWIPWVKHNLEFSYKTATNYMRLYEHRDEVFAQEPGSLQDAIATLSDRKRITPGLLSGDHKVLRRKIVKPSIVVRKRLKRMPTDPGHYEAVLQVMQELESEMAKLRDEIG